MDYEYRRMREYKITEERIIKIEIHTKNSIKLYRDLKLVVTLSTHFLRSHHLLKDNIIGCLVDKMMIILNEHIKI